jgi:hypothetical protein
MTFAFSFSTTMAVMEGTFSRVYEAPMCVSIVTLHSGSCGES